MGARMLLGRRAFPILATRCTSPSSTMSRSNSSFSNNYLVSPTQLSQALKTNSPSRISSAPKVIPICASWFLPNDPEKRTGMQVFKEAHIPGARFFDLDRIADNSSPYPHMLPNAETFAAAMSELGVNRDDTLVVYDSRELGIFSAPRVAWTLRVFGHPAVHVLNNFKLWSDQGFETESGNSATFNKTQYPAVQLERAKTIAFEELKSLIQDQGKEGSEPLQILDARSEGRWRGTDPEPRPGLSSGHMPGSVCIPLPKLLHPDTKAFLSPEELRQVFADGGFRSDVTVVSSCGSGVMAAAVDAALGEAYGIHSRIYDGSWTEWAQRAQPRDRLIEKEDS